MTTIKGPTGYGLMTLTLRAKPISKQQCFDVINAAVNEGVTFFNTGEFYGGPANPYGNMELFKEYLEKYPENRSKMVISVKGAFSFQTMRPDTSEEGLTRSIDNINKYFDNYIFEPARMDLIHPVEDVMTNLSKHVGDGKVIGLSLSEVKGSTVRRAHKVYPKLSFIEVEYSIMERGILTNGVNDACRDLKIPIIAYSPLGNGFLTGSIKSLKDFDENDMRRMHGRFSSDELIKENYKIVEVVLKMAEKKNCTPAQIALGWIRKHNEFPEKYAQIIPIPSASSVERLKENLKLVELTDDEFDEINSKIEEIEIKGARMIKAGEKYLNA
ncbi:DEKNAAC104355 [Brettanomyces naardenensis]|uniref:DEKNAAC104355 n=1 Tax=Brettanomyces naardenensis TaxID=13370 RepID=A0A448YQK1_BRENA|nr:DEKNAAC104355 [Brettanomyces naardenensis]